MNIDSLLKDTGLFWQYPVITELEFYRQNKGDVNYFPFPWATVIDKNVNQQQLLKILKAVIPANKNYYTCCQHIGYHKLVNLWSLLGIGTVYTPHKCLGRDKMGSINLVACPLYAVNLEDTTRNEVFNSVDLLNKERIYFYSFAGGYQANCYLTDIRLRIFDLNKKGRKDCIIRNTGDWHFNCDVYGGGQDINGKLNEDQKHKVKTKLYNSILLDSRYALAPSGSGPNSIRFWEALGAGSIPVLLADTLELPKHVLWEKSIVRIKESELDNIDDILGKIKEEEEKERRENCLKLYQCFKHNYKNSSGLSITLPSNLIGSHFKCFGHFITDHIYLLFRMKQYFIKQGYLISTLNIICDVKFIKPFMVQFYNLLFENVVFNSTNCDTIPLGIVLGSINGSETKRIYLAKSTRNNPNIPFSLYENARKYSETNKAMMKMFREYIWKKLNITKTVGIDFLIINRKTNGRNWQNLNKLTDELKSQSLQYKIVNMEEHTIKEQISMIYNSKTILFPSGSSQGHLFWVDPENSTCIECFIPGHRYINTIIYSKNLGIKTVALFDKFRIARINNYSLPLQKLLSYQENSIQELNSITITNEEIEKEIEWFELFLMPECSGFYMRQVREDIDVVPKCKRILDIINY